MMNKDMEIKLERTYFACPEQYSAFIGSKEVGYLRLRHGYFCVEYPTCDGELLYDTYAKGDGMFEEDEREYYLSKAKEVIMRRVEKDE